MKRHMLEPAKCIDHGAFYHTDTEADEKERGAAAHKV